ncbi:MAG: hypothetical protein PVJ33_18100 [Lysobacterales bacterium]|jgi:nucleoside-diphosphate-sugar epimerase
MPRSLVAVTGASSQLGVFALSRLLEAGLRVLAVSRKAPAAPVETAHNLRWVQPDALGADGTTPAGALTDLVSFGPLHLACTIVESNPGIRRVVAFSTSSVASKQTSVNRAERRLALGIAASEERLRALCTRRSVPLLLLRPTLIYGCGMDGNVSLLRRFGERWGFIPLAGKAHGLRQPVHADDLAWLAARALTAENPVEGCSEACGGSTLRYSDMTRKLAESCNRRVRLVRLPPWMMAAALDLLTLSPRWRSLNPEMVRRQNRNLVFDDSLLREKLGWDPRPFQPTPEDFEMPEAARELQLPVS